MCSDANEISCMFVSEEFGRGFLVLGREMCIDQARLSLALSPRVQLSPTFTSVQQAMGIKDDQFWPTGVWSHR